jgi:hypothetical protein
MSDIYDDILWKLRIPLPYNLQGLTTKDLGNERHHAANEIERLRRIVTMMVNDYTIEYGHTFERNLKMIEMSAEEEFEREKKIEYLPEIKSMNTWEVGR